MAEHQSRGRKAKRSQRTRLRRRGAAVVAQPGVSGIPLGRAADILPQGEREAFTAIPDLQPAQRAMVARCLQRSKGNSYVQRLLVGEKAVAIAAGGAQVGIIARWPPDSDEEKRRLLTEASANIFTLIELPLSHANAWLNEEDPPFWATYGTLEELDETVGPWDFDLPEFSTVMIGECMAYVQQALSALEALDREGANIRGLVHSAWFRASRHRWTPSWIPRARWQRGVVAPLERARRLTSRRRPNFPQALRFVNRALVNVARTSGRSPEEGDLLRTHQSRIGSAEAALSVLTTERGNSRRYVRGLLASGNLVLGAARDEIQEELRALGDGAEHRAGHTEGLTEEYAGSEHSSGHGEGLAEEYIERSR